MRADPPIATITHDTAAPASPLDYHATSFSQGRMEFAWEELTPAERAQAYADWHAGRGLLGGDPRRRPNAHLLPDWGLDQPFFRALALADARGRGAELQTRLAAPGPVEVEIGFGRGDFLLHRSATHPATLFLGYDVKTKAVRLMLSRIARFSLANLWLSDDDSRFSLPRVLDDGRLDAVHILFPDPWWKSQHRVKRLCSPPFVDLLAAKLRPGGLLHFKSDVEAYAELVRYLVEGHGAFAPHDPALAARLGPAVPTHREAWCLRHGKPVFAAYFLRR